MMLFSIGLGWIVLGSLGQNWTAAGLVCRLCMWLFPAEKNEKEEGPARASPVSAPMPKSVSF